MARIISLGLLSASSYSGKYSEIRIPTGFIMHGYKTNKLLPPRFNSTLP
jgi:hypothetical protein